MGKRWRRTSRRIRTRKNKTNTRTYGPFFSSCSNKLSGWQSTKRPTFFRRRPKAIVVSFVTLSASSSATACNKWRRKRNDHHLPPFLIMIAILFSAGGRHQYYSYITNPADVGTFLPVDDFNCFHTRVCLPHPPVCRFPGPWNVF